MITLSSTYCYYLVQYCLDTDLAKVKKHALSYDSLKTLLNDPLKSSFLFRWEPRPEKVSHISRLFYCPAKTSFADDETHFSLWSLNKRTAFQVALYRRLLKHIHLKSYEQKPILFYLNSFSNFQTILILKESLKEFPKTLGLINQFSLIKTLFFGPIFLLYYVV